jgi:peptidoglycan hydrolase-like amidase
MTTPPVPRLRAALAALATALLLVTGLAVTPLAAPAGAQEGPTTMTFTGRGWGHGRGMSQWGSQGYATNFGWSYTRILDHYYGGTTMGTRADKAVLVRLMAQEGKTTTVQNDGGTLRLTGNKGLDVSGMKAARMSKLADGTLKVEQAPSCDGPWTTVNGGGNAHVVAIGQGGDGTLRLCREDGVHVWYPGTIQARVHENVQRTINGTTMERQLRGIVPRESPASWHADALKAQSVAARSYALAGDGRHLPFADTCDTTLCQVYAGWFQQTPGGAKTPTTDPRTDAAIAATAGQVRVHASGAIARTEFSSSTGGYTAGGTFPAVVDEGDSIAPRHTWKLTVDMSRVESQYGKGGRLTEVDVTRRNGLGADGGRVLNVRLRFSNGTVADVTGNQLRSAAGLYSDWFTPVCGVEVRYVNAVYDLFLGRTPSGAEAEAGCAQARGGQRFALTTGLSRSDEWAGVQISELYEKVFGRPADSGGRSYWLQQVERGMRIEQIAAQLYGSAEYFNAAGRTNERFVDELYLDLMGRPSDPSGKAHWVQQLDAGRLNRTQVAASFYASLESRRDRVDALYQQVLDRAADSAGRSYWVDQLLRVGDVALAAHLAASDEYYQRSLAG